MADAADVKAWTIVRRWLVRALFIALLVYASACVYLYVDQRNLLYFPEATRADATHFNFSLSSGHLELKGWEFHAGQPDALLYFGGNGENLGIERNDIAAMFPKRAVYLLPYRGYGANGGEPSQRALFADALALFDKVHRTHVRIAVVGRSLGSGVASYLASRKPVQKLALVTPFDSLVAAARFHYPLFPVGWLLKDRYESARYLRKYRKPILILRAGDDQVVPAASTARLIAALPVKPLVVTLRNTGHNSISDDPVYAKALARFMQ
jgi:pimeloyl-ACP methyl ester carboxylesterase